MDRLTWLDDDYLPLNLQGEGGWALMCEARGRTYKVFCGKGLGGVGVSVEAEGKVRDHLKAKGSGLICMELGGVGKGTCVPQQKAKGKGAVPFPVFTKATGHIKFNHQAQCKTQVGSIQTSGIGRGYSPIWTTTDLGILFPYLGNFFPEVADQAPAPLPEQGLIELHILDQVIKGVEYHGDTRAWTLIGVTFENKPVMTLRNAPRSSYPMRHVTDPHLYKLTIGYLAKLWDVRPIMVGAAPPSPMTQEHLRELQRQRYLQ